MRAEPLYKENAGRGIFSADALKIIAIIAMFIDHSAYLVSPEYYAPLGMAMHFVGRITGPTMFYFIAEGYHYTRNANRYTLRLAVFAALSYLPFIYFQTGALPTAESWLSLNVIYTLLLALLAVRVRHEVENPPLKILLLVGITLLSLFGDWGYTAIFAVLLFDYFRGNFKNQAVAYCALVVLRIMPNIATVVLGLATQGGPYTLYQNQMSYIVVSLGMLLPIVLLALYNGKKGGLGRAGKWLFYIFYPAHLLLLGWLRF